MFAEIGFTCVIYCALCGLKSEINLAKKKDGKEMKRTNKKSGAAWKIKFITQNTNEFDVNDNGDDRTVKTGSSRS